MIGGWNISESIPMARSVSEGMADGAVHSIIIVIEIVFQAIRPNFKIHIV